MAGRRVSTHFHPKRPSGTVIVSRRTNRVNRFSQRLRRFGNIRSRARPPARVDLVDFRRSRHQVIRNSRLLPAASPQFSSTASTRAERGPLPR